MKSSCTNACGNGIKNSTEVCDDGDTDSGDGCAADCMSIEAGFVCTGGLGALSVCSANTCGDGMTYGAE